MVIPRGWIDCQPAMASGLVVDTFFVFKTPLHENMNSTLSPEDQLSPEKVRLELLDRHKKKIGLWIDMNNTDVYFDREDVEQMEGVTYKEFRFPGHKTPTREVQEEFYQICDDFLSMKPKPEGCIAVNATNGFNRPGFFICSYLIAQKNFGALEALEEFRRARPPGIYEQHLVNVLCYVYNNHFRADGEPEVQAPNVEVPVWDTQRIKAQAKERRRQERLQLEQLELEGNMAALNF